MASFSIKTSKALEQDIIPVISQEQARPLLAATKAYNRCLEHFAAAAEEKQATDPEIETESKVAEAI